MMEIFSLKKYARTKVTELSLGAKEAGRTVILSSHILDFLQSISDFSYFLKGGSVIKRVEKGNDLEKNYRQLYLEEKANE